MIRSGGRVWSGWKRCLGRGEGWRGKRRRRSGMVWTRAVRHRVVLPTKTPDAPRQHLPGAPQQTSKRSRGSRKVRHGPRESSALRHCWELALCGEGRRGWVTEAFATTLQQHQQWHGYRQRQTVCLYGTHEGAAMETSLQHSMQNMAYSTSTVAYAIGRL